MGAGIKTIQRIMMMTEAGSLPFGSQICDLGVTQLFGDGLQDAARSMSRYYTDLTVNFGGQMTIDETALLTVKSGSFLGTLLKLVGFRYSALDIFRAPDTILFDLNRHSPGPRLENRFDLVMNLGTTEHVFNQFNAFNTIHQLTKPGGVMYHDLPMLGYLDHGFFRYDQLFFQMLAKENDYAINDVSFSVGERVTVPASMRSKGLSLGPLEDVGIEVTMIKTKDSEFRVPLEESTSLGLAPYLDADVDNLSVKFSNQKLTYTSVAERQLRRFVARVRKLFLRMF